MERNPATSGLEVKEWTMQYAVIIEKGETSYGAYVPDLPGCIAAAKTREEVETLIREAIEFHLEGMAEDGDPVPEPTSIAINVDVNVPITA
jgi:predicted RNase H-like HicB family nuclease